MAFSTHYLLMLIFEGINFLFVFTIFIYSIVMIAATNKLLLPFNDFINLNCGDTFTNSVIKWAFQGLTSVNSTLIPIAVLSGLELGYLIFFYTYVIIKKNSQGYIELSDRDRNE